MHQTDDEVPQFSEADQKLVDLGIITQAPRKAPPSGTPEHLQWQREQDAAKDSKFAAWEAVLPKLGSTVVHRKTHEQFTVVGFKNEGSKKGYSLKVRDVDGAERHISPRWVDEVEASGN